MCIKQYRSTPREVSTSQTCSTSWTPSSAVQSTWLLKQTSCEIIKDRSLEQTLPAGHKSGGMFLSFGKFLMFSCCCLHFILVRVLSVTFAMTCAPCLSETIGFNRLFCGCLQLQIASYFMRDNHEHVGLHPNYRLWKVVSATESIVKTCTKLRCTDSLFLRNNASDLVGMASGSTRRHLVFPRNPIINSRIAYSTHILEKTSMQQLTAMPNEVPKMKDVLRNSCTPETHPDRANFQSSFATAAESLGWDAGCSSDQERKNLEFRQPGISTNSKTHKNPRGNRDRKA